MGTADLWLKSPDSIPDNADQLANAGPIYPTVAATHCCANGANIPHASTNIEPDLHNLRVIAGEADTIPGAARWCIARCATAA